MRTPGYVAAALLCCSSGGLAQSSPAGAEPAPPPATAEALTPFPPPAPDPSVRRHDGFYLRLALGAGYFHDAIDGSRTGDASLSGAALTSQIALGGTIAPGLAIGGMSFGTSAVAPSLDSDESGAQAPGVASLSLVGVFADWYFEPTAGLHAQALLGFALLSAGGTRDARPQGAGAALGAGYEWWVAAQWSIGVLGTVTAAVLGAEQDDVSQDHFVIAPALLATFTHH